MLTFDTPEQTIRLVGDWQVAEAPLATHQMPDAAAYAEAYTLPECAHLQPALFPDRPYWGEHLRPLNDSAWGYRKVFDAPTRPFKRARLRFEGVDYFASVFLNGQLVGAHEGAFVPFTVDCTDALRPGEANVLEVRVASPWDRPNTRGSYPINHVLRGLVKGLYEHGEGVIPPNVNPLGIWRPVWLILDEGVSIDRVRVRTELDGTVQLAFTIHNATSNAWHGTLELAATADNHDGPGAGSSLPLTLAPGTQTVSQTLHMEDPRLWWPWDHGEPNLYALEAQLIDEGEQVVSRLTETFGIRTVRLDRAPERFTFYVNERPFFLRGSSYMPGIYLSQNDRAALERDVELARQANLNLLRVHVHVSPPELYDICDRAGILIWQDFELNWVQDPSPEFEVRALRLQQDMINMLANHPAILTWTCHNEPTMVFAHRENYEKHPDPALYAEALELDDTRPIFICSGQMEHDWQRAGDIHTYYGAMWSRNYTDVYSHQMRMNTEFGFEAPAALSTLQKYPDAWERLQHLEDKIDDLWAYQAELIQFHVEHLRRTRISGSAGYVHFWLADLVPQVGCGVLDADRLPKAGYAALKRASQPLQVSLEHNGRRPVALWVFNDLPQAFPGLKVGWQVYDAKDELVRSGDVPFDAEPNASQWVGPAQWLLAPVDMVRVELSLRDAENNVLAENSYDRPLEPMPRPAGYPWKFDPYLGCKVFDRKDAPSLVDQSSNRLIKLIPLKMREHVAEWAMRQRLPVWVLSFVARMTRGLVQA